VCGVAEGVAVFEAQDMAAQIAMLCRAVLLTEIARDG